MSDIYNLINSIADNKLIVFILSAILGLLLNFFLSLAGFNWLKTLNQRLIYIIFPPAMTVIAWTIAGNLGLSLGMIGALSIVRFRTPVKSPIELVFYFVLIVIGISITVAPIYTVLIFLLTCSVPFIFRYIYKLDDGHYEFSENENELSKLSLANFVIESNVDEDFVENIKKINFKLLDLKNEETNTYNLSFEIDKLDQYQELKKILSQCGKIQKSEFIL
jgi:hypothetical protein